MQTALITYLLSVLFHCVLSDSRKFHCIVFKLRYVGLADHVFVMISFGLAYGPEKNRPHWIYNFCHFYLGAV